MTMTTHIIIAGKPKALVIDQGLGLPSNNDMSDIVTLW